MRGLLAGKDLRLGTITVARNAFPPLTMRVSPAALITRDGAPSTLSALEIGSQTVFPDVVLVSTAVAAGGGLVAGKIKATSRDHYWYGRLTGIDPTSLSIAVTRADGQRRVFRVTERTNIQLFGAGHADWSNLKLGGVLEVVWIPGDNDDKAAVLDAHSIVLNKTYEGILHRAPGSH
jgi:hypothetical protein